jgi:8-oxo-dGTP pyrophosphatase MutT (NUDIX family)
MLESRREHTEGNSEADFQNFCGSLCDSLDTVSEKAKNPEKERSDRRKGIKELAIIALDMPKDSTWADLAKVGGYDHVKDIGFESRKKTGYQKYLERVAQLPQHRFRMTDDETRMDAWAKREGVTLQKVSGVTLYKGRGSRDVPDDNGPIVDRVFLSETNDKPWSHQPFGGKRDKTENPVAALLREFGEEAGWEAAKQLMRALKEGHVTYLGFYVPKPEPGDKKALLIQSFAVDDEYFGASRFVSGSDSKGYVWAGTETLDASRRIGKKVTLTTQAEQYMGHVFRFDRRIHKFTNRDPSWTGDPERPYVESADSMRDDGYQRPQWVDDEQFIAEAKAALEPAVRDIVPIDVMRLVDEGKYREAERQLPEALISIGLTPQEQHDVTDAFDWYISLEEKDVPPEIATVDDAKEVLAEDAELIERLRAVNARLDTEEPHEPTKSQPPSSRGGGLLDALRDYRHAQTMKEGPHVRQGTLGDARMTFVNTEGGTTIRFWKGADGNWEFRVPNKAAQEFLVREGKSEVTYSMTGTTPVAEALRYVNEHILKNSEKDNHQMSADVIAEAVRAV